MDTVLALAAIVLGLICWVGQTLAVFDNDLAARLGVSETEAEMDKVMLTFERMSQGIMDVLLAWTLPIAGLLMLLDNRWWPVFALVGGGVYLYFPGVFMISRIVLKRDGVRTGSRSSERTAFTLGTLWTLLAIVMILRGIQELDL